MAFFPLPAVRVRELHVEGSTPQAPPLLEVDEAHLRVALLPLLLGRVILRAVELDAPRVHLELDSQGRPQLPGPEEPADRARSTASADEPEEARAPTFAVDTIRISDGALTAGPWQVESFDLRGRLRLDRSAELVFDGDLTGLGQLRDGRAELQGVGTDAFSVMSRGKLERIDLGELKQRLGLEPELAGRLDGTFEVGVREGVVHQARVDFRASEVALASAELELMGEVDLVAELGSVWKLDLTRSRVDLGETLSKPAGLAASISGVLGPRLALAAVREVLAVIGPNELNLALALDATRPSVRTQPATLELKPLAGLVRGPLRSLAGRVQLGAWKVQLQPLELSGKAELEGVTLDLEHGSVLFEGPLRGEGTRLHATAIRMLAAGESVTFSGSYDLAKGLAALDARVSGAKLEVLEQVFVGSSDVAGRLDGRVTLTGPPDATALKGSGRFEITDGRIRGFSLLKHVLGDLAALPVLLAQVKGKDLSRYEEEEFQRLAADFRLREGRLHTDNLTLEYRNATAQLRGSVGLLDGSLALTGKLVISRELDAELANQKGGREKVIPIAGIGGTVSRPRVQLDRAALAAVAATYLSHGRLGEKLEETLGREGAEAVRGLLDQILGGRKEEP